MTEDRSPDARPGSGWKGIADYATIGLEMGLSVAIGVGAGMWLDNHFGTRYFRLIGLGVGLAAAFRALWRIAARARADAAAAPPATTPPPGSWPDDGEPDERDRPTDDRGRPSDPATPTGTKDEGERR